MAELNTSAETFSNFNVGVGAGETTADNGDEPGDSREAVKERVVLMVDLVDASCYSFKWKFL